MYCRFIEEQVTKILNRKKDIIKIINSISGKYSAYEVFSDWIRCCSLSISNNCCVIHGKVWEEREKSYLDTISRYSRDEVQKFSEMLALLTETLESDMEDILGQAYMEAGMGSKAAGQFFTPFNLSLLCAELEIPKELPEGKYTVNEPSCGGGGMIIAAARVLRDRGIDYQRKMDVVAQDLDWKGVYMCYLQLSLLGISAVCVQGNTLSDPYIEGQTDPSHILITPAKMGLLI